MDEECEKIFKEWVEENNPTEEMKEVLIKFKHLFFSFLTTFLSKTIKKMK